MNPIKPSPDRKSYSIDFNYDVNSHSAKNLMLIENTKKNKDNTVNVRYTLIQTDHPKLLEHSLFFRSLFSGEISRVLSYEETREILYKAANEIDDPSHQYLNKEKELRNRAQSFDGIETPEHSAKREGQLQSGMEKFHRAGSLAKNIGRGLLQAENLGYKPLTLNENYYSETIHHKRNDPQFMEWRDSKSTESFKEWLKTTPDATASASVEGVFYLRDADRSSYKITFNKGKLQNNEHPLNTNHLARETGTESNVFAFVIGPDESLYAGPHTVDRFHHSSFLAGGAVISAGEIQTDPNGMVVKLSNKSGHYQPGIDQMLSSLTILAKNGIALSAVKIELTSPNDTLIYNSGSVFLESKGKCLPDQYAKAIPISDDFFSATLEKDPTGNIEKLIIAPDCGSSFFTLDAFHELQEKGVNFAENFKIIENFKTDEQGDDFFEYTGNELIQSDGKSLPIAWNGGIFEKDGDKITGLHMNRVDSTKPTTPRLIEYQQRLLFRLHARKLNLSEVSVSDRNGIILNKSAEAYVSQLGNAQS